jgi:hypothetical protein
VGMSEGDCYAYCYAGPRTGGCEAPRAHTVLRNRAYLGEIYYRGNWYPAPHEPLIPTDPFEKAQAILAERCEDRSRRASSPAEYLLTGRVRCGRCGRAYIGTAAHGRNGRYTYYTCFTRARYDTKHCPNDCLPAEHLERAVTRRLWKVLDDHKLIKGRDQPRIRTALPTRRRTAVRACRHSACPRFALTTVTWAKLFGAQTMR